MTSALPTSLEVSPRLANSLSHRSRRLRTGGYFCEPPRRRPSSTAEAGTLGASVAPSEALLFSDPAPRSSSRRAPCLDTSRIPRCVRLSRCQEPRRQPSNFPGKNPSSQENAKPALAGRIGRGRMGDNPVLPKRAFRPTIERVYRGVKCPTELPSEFQLARRLPFYGPRLPPPPTPHPSLTDK